MERLGEFVVDQWLLFVALVVIVVMLILGEAKRKLLGFKEIKPAEATSLINKEGAVVVDVRDDKEYGEGHILNAINMPLGLFEQRVQELESYKSDPIIVYCRTGQRSAKVGAVLRRQGFERLYKISGGILAWTSANLPVTKK